MARLKEASTGLGFVGFLTSRDIAIPPLGEDDGSELCFFLCVCLVRGPGGLFAWTELVSSEAERAATGFASASSSLTTSTADFRGAFFFLVFKDFTAGPTAEAAVVSTYPFLRLASQVFT